MKIRSFLAAAIVACAALSAKADASPIFTETFAEATGKWSASGGAVYDNQGWSASGSVYRGEGGIRIGTSSAAATLTSKLIPISNPGVETTISISVQAAGYYEQNGGLSLKAVDENDADISGASWTKTLKSHSSTDAVALDDTDSDLWFSDMTFTTASSFKLVFTTSLSSPKSALRVLIGYIGVTEETSSGGGDTPVGPVALNTPTDLEAYPITASGFTLSWTGDEHADSYEVEVQDGQGNAAGSVSGSVSPSGTVWTGLLSDTTYKVRVKALAAEGSEEYAASAQSEPLSVTTALAGGLVRATIFEEGFSGANNAWSNNSAKPDDSKTDSDSWTFGTRVYNARSAIKIGGASNVECASSPEITLSNHVESATVTLSFSAAAYPGNTTKASVSFVDCETGLTNAIAALTAITPDPLGDASSTEWTGGSDFKTSIVVPSRFKLLFETLSSASDKRLLLDSIVVSQVVNPSLVALAAPVATAGEATMTTLAFSWGAVADATGYAVELRDGSGARVAYDAAVTGTATTFTDLNWNSDYTIRVKALGDDSSSCNSPWSEGVVGHTLENVLAPEWSATAGAGDAVMAVVSNKTFSVSAERDGAPLAVSFDGLSPAAAGTAPTFSAGAFSWTPSAGDEGTTFTATFTTDSGSFSTNIVFGVLARPALVEPAIKTNAVACNAATVSWDAPPQIRAVSYDYRLWSGSDTPTDVDVDQERFHDRVLPAGWVLSGTGWQTSTGYNPTPVKFDDAGDFAVSALYPASVTNLAFTLRKSNGTDSPVVKFYASTGSTNALAWTEVPIELDPGKATKNFQLEFRAADGYRRFKWVYVTKDSNVNLGSVAAKYEGAGVKFKAGSATEYVAAPSGNVLDLTGLRSETNYFLEVRVADESGTKKSATLRFSTLAVPKCTLMIFR